MREGRRISFRCVVGEAFDEAITPFVRRTAAYFGSEVQTFHLRNGAGAVNEITVSPAGVVSSPPHLSKGEGYVLTPGDWIAVKTPGGGGYGPAAERDPAMVERDIAGGYYTDVDAVRLFSSTRAAAAE